MPTSRRIGIIDIGSNSIRLVIYELHSTLAYRVIGEFKQSARLSQRIGADNTLSYDNIQFIVRILLHFQQITSSYQVTEIRAAATAAIRNAANSMQIIDTFQEHSELKVELLSGEDEARIGFLGMINSLNVEDGLLVDIGGGSTEVSLFRSRKLERSVSFPFGAVNTTARFAAANQSMADLDGIRLMVQQAIANEPWIKEQPGFPMIGLGGTIRSLCKINQKKRKYPLALTHNYSISAEDMDELMSWLPTLSAEKRKKVDGLSKDRYDIIVPGLTILHTLYEACGASHYVISGAGLRDGLFYETYLSGQNPSIDLAERSARNMLDLHSCTPIKHLEQVGSFVNQLFDALQNVHGLEVCYRNCLHTAALLYRIGVSVNYYQFSKHSFYMIANSRLDGLSHRETLLCAAIASFKTKGKTQQIYLQYKEILHESDVDLIVKLGTLLQAAIALDSSETQVFSSISPEVVDDNELRIRVQKKNDPSHEYGEIASLNKDFKKIWGMKLTIHDNEASFSRS
ncbi:Ppx/GppA phosphatase family protein [Paenibacillus sp. UNC451MF]|uniref:Ppx/GppA phosphatase family protein n=1 Tax=Paenibacillus sp. UNC451MF TaxID=1449063 RepID=UPI00048F8612|nr:Ppx/GppA phosphatase family protein [Paenibacillus sp. UNC451MF]